MRPAKPLFKKKCEHRRAAALFFLNTFSLPGIQNDVT